MMFDAEAAYNELQPYFQDRVRRNELLAEHSAFGVGGAAEIWVSLESKQELIGIVSLCLERRWPLLIVGNGTNVLYADAGIQGIVAHISFNHYSIEQHDETTASLIAEAGVSWPRLMQELAPQGWGGLEFGVGIPGTLGGGIISNAGAHNDDLGRVLDWIEILDARGYSEEQMIVPQLRRYQRDELDLGYRHSRFREQRRVSFDEQGNLVLPKRQMIEPPEIVMLLSIHLHREDPAKLQASIARYLQHRKKTQPPQQHTGLIFKDPAGQEANRLIALAGLQGQTYGNAQVSPLAPNFIVNLGGARASDVVALIKKTYQCVRDQSGIDLELEVELRGDWQMSSASHVF